MLLCKPAGAECRFLMENNVTGLVSNSGSQEGTLHTHFRRNVVLGRHRHRGTHMVLPPLTPPPYQARCFRVPFKAKLFVRITKIRFLGRFSHTTRYQLSGQLFRASLACLWSSECGVSQSTLEREGLHGLHPHHTMHKLQSCRLTEELVQLNRSTKKGWRNSRLGCWEDSKITSSSCEAGLGHGKEGTGSITCNRGAGASFCLCCFPPLALGFPQEDSKGLLQQVLQVVSQDQCGPWSLELYSTPCKSAPAFV